MSRLGFGGFGRGSPMQSSSPAPPNRMIFSSSTGRGIAMEPFGANFEDFVSPPMPGAVNARPARATTRPVAQSGIGGSNRPLENSIQACAGRGVDSRGSSTGLYRSGFGNTNAPVFSNENWDEEITQQNGETTRPRSQFDPPAGPINVSMHASQRFPQNTGFQTSTSNFGASHNKEAANSGQRFGDGGFGFGFASGRETKTQMGDGFHSTSSYATNSKPKLSGFGGFDNPGFSESALRYQNRPRTPSPSPERVQKSGLVGFAAIREGMKEQNERKWKNLPQIKKDFYSENPEVTAMFPEEVNSLRQQKNDIVVEDWSEKKDRQVMKPVWTFEHALNDYPEILSEMYKNEFTEPSPIQCQMWPITMTGYDCIGIAQTGTGKTLGFLVPAFIHIDGQMTPREQRWGPTCLVLTPTRELALQIASEVKKYHYKGIKSVCVYGGACRKSQVDICSKGVDIVIATPGRFNDLVCDQVISLKSITFLVLDEADRMLDMGFEPQIRKILCEIRPDRHTIMTSATWPAIVRDLAKRYTKDPFLIHIGSLDLTACKNVELIIEMVEEEEKRTRLLSIIQNMKPIEKALIFVGRKNAADHLSSDLIRMGIDCQSMHGDRDQMEREQALKELKSGRVKLLIATDVASRGLDIVDITHVINYDFPKNIEEYVHRVGRTGRAGRSGKSISFMTRSDWRNAKDLITILEKNCQEVPNTLRAMADRFEAHKQSLAERMKSNPPPWKRDNYSSRRNEFCDPFTGEPVGFTIGK